MTPSDSDKPTDKPTDRPGDWRENFRRLTFEKGTLIFEQGQAGSEMYFVEKGRVLIWRGTPDDKVVLGTVEESGIFGEMTLIDNKHRMANATASTQTVLLVMRQEEFEQRMQKMNPFMRMIVSTMAENLRRLNDYIGVLETERNLQ